MNKINLGQILYQQLSFLLGNTFECLEDIQGSVEEKPCPGLEEMNNMTQVQMVTLRRVLKSVDHNSLLVVYA